MTEEYSEDEALEWLREFSSAFELLYQLCIQEGVDLSSGAEVSPEAARAFARGLMDDQTVDSARQRMRRDPEGAAAFYAVGHTVSDMSISGQVKFVRRVSGEHPAFLVVAAAVLNYLDDGS